jgi:hypothetical protein
MFYLHVLKKTPHREAKDSGPNGGWDSLNISFSGMQYWFISVVPNYLNLATFSNYLLAVFMLRCRLLCALFKTEHARHLIVSVTSIFLFSNLAANSMNRASKDQLRQTTLYTSSVRPTLLCPYTTVCNFTVQNLQTSVVCDRSRLYTGLFPFIDKMGCYCICR